MRLDVLPINESIYRYSDSVNAKMCPVCKSCTENLHHFLKDCPLYSNLRNDICPDLISLSIEEIVKGRGSKGTKKFRKAMARGFLTLLKNEKQLFSMPVP